MILTAAVSRSIPFFDTRTFMPKTRAGPELPGANPG